MRKLLTNNKSLSLVVCFVLLTLCCVSCGKKNGYDCPNKLSIIR